MWPFSLLRRKKRASPPASTAQQIRDALWDEWLNTDDTMPSHGADWKQLLPRGTYTIIARKLSTDPTYVSIVANQAGFRIARRDERLM